MVRPKLYVRMYLIAINHVLLLLKSRTLEGIVHIRRHILILKVQWGHIEGNHGSEEAHVKVKIGLHGCDVKLSFRF